MDSDDLPRTNHSSGLRQPSKIPPPGKHLVEISDSANNARAAMPPPAEPGSLKHKGSARMIAPPIHTGRKLAHAQSPYVVPGPTPKRQTLAERAGTSRLAAPTPASSRLMGSGVKGTSLVGARNPSFASSTSYRDTSVPARSILGNSHGPSSRPPTAQSRYRPQSSVGHHRTTRPVTASSGRPASSMENHESESDSAAAGKRQGMSSISLSKSDAFPGRLSRRPATALGNYKHSTHVPSDRPSHDAPAAPRTNTSNQPKFVREFSLCTAMRSLNLRPWSCSGEPEDVDPFSSPSHIPKPLPVQITPPSPSWLPPKISKTLKPSASPKKLPYLTRDTRLQAWDTKGRLEDMEQLYSELKDKMNGSTAERNGLEEALEIYKARSNELEAMRTQLLSTNTTLQVELETTKTRIQTVTSSLDDERRKYSAELAELKANTSSTLENERRQHCAEVSELKRTASANMEDERRKLIGELADLKRHHSEELFQAKRQAEDELGRQGRKYQEEISELERRLRHDVEDAESRRARELQEARAQSGLEKQSLEMEMSAKLQQVRNVEVELEQVQGDLRQEKASSRNLQAQISELQAQNVILDSSARNLRARIDFLESDCQSQAKSFEDLQQQLEDAQAAELVAKEKLRKEETLRRKLHNQVQELKGNIRVFCRVRPSLETEPSAEAAKIAYPDTEADAKELEVMGPEEKSSLGNISTKRNAFSFDKVFGPSSQNQDVFDEISQLVQSALDGYNVCIFCYGQTGSGKTYTMSAEDGMIPRAVHQIYETAKSLEEKGWSYSMEGSFVEVYNENINDLLGKPDDFDKKKHEIRHDLQKCKTYVSDLTTVNLNSPSKVESILRRAMANRSVAATKANERSSRSHSVFMLTMTGHNKLTGEKSEGTLNLVDLAGSERLSHSGATGDRLKETQNINKSLSCLGDVIGALGQGKDGGHVPYRNSKLTYLLQFSLGGNSKTLMFVMVSPLQAHLSETLTSLKFATKVHNTHIGTAKKHTKIRDS